MFLFSIHHSYSSIDDININIQYSFTSCSKISEISEISVFSNMPYVYLKTRNFRNSWKSRNELFFAESTHVFRMIIIYIDTLVQDHSVTAIARGMSIALPIVLYTSKRRSKASKAKCYSNWYGFNNATTMHFKHFRVFEHSLCLLENTEL